MAAPYIALTACPSTPPHQHPQHRQPLPRCLYLIKHRRPIWLGSSLNVNSTTHLRRALCCRSVLLKLQSTRSRKRRNMALRSARRNITRRRRRRKRRRSVGTHKVGALIVTCSYSWWFKPFCYGICLPISAVAYSLSDRMIRWAVEHGIKTTVTSG